MSKKRKSPRVGRKYAKRKPKKHSRSGSSLRSRRVLSYRAASNTRGKPKRKVIFRSTVHPSNAYPLAHHRVHLSFDAPLDALPPSDSPVEVTSAGSTTHFDLAYQTSLGQAGASVAQYLRSACEYDLQRTANLFGLKWDAMHFTITVLQGNGGAWHPDPCSNTNIFAGVQTAILPNQIPNYLFLRSMVLSEIVEVLGSRFRWDCGCSNGEGLSRVISDFLVPAQRPNNFLSAKIWLAPPSARGDFVSNTFQGDDDHPGDRDYPSIGCSVLFLNWMHFQVGIPWEEIIDNGAATLEQTYDAIVGSGSDAFGNFSSFINRNAEEVNARANVSDNVFPI